MVEVTEPDITAALKHMGFDSVADLHYWAQDNNELNRFDALTQAFATHREAAAKAERDRLRNLPDETALEVWINLPAKYEGISKKAMRAIATALADALESKP